MAIPIEQNKARIRQLFEEINQPGADKFSLGNEALALIDGILKDNPFCLDARVDKMWLYTGWVFDQTHKIMEEARFIIEHPQFGFRRTVGYDWLYWVYYNKLGMTDKVVELLEEELVDIQSFFAKPYEKEQVEGEIFDKWASLERENQQDDRAAELWRKSFEKYPFIHKRNAVAGLFFLAREEWTQAAKFLSMHYLWSFSYEDDYRKQYGANLKKLYDEGKLEGSPDLTGLLFNVLRNEKRYFNIEGSLEFYEKYFPALKKTADQYPENTLLWNAVANTYYYDLKNDDQAFDAFIVLMNTRQGFLYNNIRRFYDSAVRSGKDFFGQTFHFDTMPAQALYGIMTDLLDIANNTDDDERRLKLLNTAIQAGQAGYSKIHAFITKGEGDSINNLPHIYAMMCNNFAKALSSYTFYKNDAEKKINNFFIAANIHMNGYAVSPFLENLAEASYDYFRAEKYEKSIACSEKLLRDHYDELSVYDLQAEYWQMTYAYIRMEDLENAKKYYFIAKDFYNSYGKGNKEAEYKFIFTGKLLFRFVVEQLQDHNSMIPEMEWYLNEKVALMQAPEEHGLVHYFLGLCYRHTGEKVKAAGAFRIATRYMAESDDSYYVNKSDQAVEALKELGEDVEKKKILWRKRIKDILFFPVGLLTILGLLIMAKSSKDEHSKSKK